MEKAVIVVDMLNDFILDNAPLKVDENKKIIPNIRKLINDARSNGEYIVYVCDSHQENDKEFEIWPKHCVKNTHGAEIVSELKPLSNDFIVNKTTYDGFYGTVLHDLLINLGVGKIKISGCVSNICILHTASSAVLRGYEVEIPTKCIASLDEYSREYAINHFRNVLNITLI